MKKIGLYSLIASVSMFSIVAFAAPTTDTSEASDSALTTKGYVDAGLKYIYKVASGASDGAVQKLQNTLSDGNGGLIDVSSLKDKIGDEQMGTQETTITGAIKELNAAVNNLNTSGQTYNEGTGIKITESTNAPATIGLDLPSNPSAGSYVYKIDEEGEGTWAPIEVEDSWNPGFLTNP